MHTPSRLLSGDVVRAGEQLEHFHAYHLRLQARAHARARALADFYAVRKSPTRGQANGSAGDARAALHMHVDQVNVKPAPPAPPAPLAAPAVCGCA